MRLNIRFGGFYGSLHEDLVDNMVNNYYDVQDYYDPDINYRAIFNEYIVEYMNSFEEWINDNYDMDISFSDIELDSPRFYNYSTDEIIADVKYRDCEMDLKNDYKEFLEYVKDNTKSYDGYISFYNYNEVISDKDGMLDFFKLDYLVNKFNDEEFLSYYDMNNMYELIYDMDMPERIAS